MSEWFLQDIWLEFRAAHLCFQSDILSKCHTSGDQTSLPVCQMTFNLRSTCQTRDHMAWPSLITRTILIAKTLNAKLWRRTHGTELDAHDNMLQREISLLQQEHNTAFTCSSVYIHLNSPAYCLASLATSSFVNTYFLLANQYCMYSINNTSTPTNTTSFSSFPVRDIMLELIICNTALKHAHKWSKPNS